MLLRTLTLIASLAFVCPAWAQIGVGLELPQGQFLPGESIPVSVRITNFTGQSLKLGLDDLWLQFNLEAKSGRPIASIANVPVEGEFDLPNATIATKRLDLAPYYHPLDPGYYILSANVVIQAWNRQVAAPAVTFTVVQGTVLWERAFGVPSPGGSGAPPEFRRYALQQASYLNQLNLYARVSRADDNQPLAVFPLGPMLTFSNPEKQIDRTSRFHVLYQYGARSFYYYIIDPSGDISQRHTYDYVGSSRPSLRVDDDGNVFVNGGARRPARDDFPPEPKTPTQPANTPTPAADNLSDAPPPPPAPPQRPAP